MSKQMLYWMLYLWVTFNTIQKTIIRVYQALMYQDILTIHGGGISFIIQVFTLQTQFRERNYYQLCKQNNVHCETK